MSDLERKESNFCFMHEAVILSAGFGKRLLPITQRIPKAIFPILEKPLIVHVMDRLGHIGITRFFINVHYLKEKIINLIESTSYKNSVQFQIENELLLTGGGLKGLLERVTSENVLVHNVDIVEEFNYRKLLAEHVEKGNDITWILSPTSGNVLTEKDMIIGFGDGGITFTGVGIYRKDINRLMPEGKFLLVPWIEEMLKIKKIKLGFVIDSNYWVDVGTPLGIFRAYIRELKKMGKNILIESHKIDFSGTFSGLVYIGKKVKISGNGHIKDAVILGNSFFAGRVIVRRNIIYDNLKATF